MVERVEFKDESTEAPDAEAGLAEVEKPEAPAEKATPRPEATEDGADGAPNAWSDEAAEAAFLSEAKARGEPVRASAATVEAAEEREAKPLPPLGDLVKRLSPAVREVLDDLFRVKFTTVRRVPKQALKTGGG